MAEHPCIYCNIEVTSRAHAIACDSCGRWSHRRHTEITHQQYMQLRSGEVQIEWFCNGCRNVDEPPPPLEIPVSPLRNLAQEDLRHGGNTTIPDVSFDLAQEYERPTPVVDTSLPDDLELNDEIPADDAVITYEIVESGTKRGAAKLISSDGYSYTKGVKELARERVFEPAAVIVERVMKDMVAPNDVSLPKPANLVRVVNHHRRLRPDDPKDLAFELDRNFIGEDFIVDDLVLDGARHIVFGTQRQLDLLRQAKMWYMDGTFKVVKQPFYQLHSIHTFVKKGEDEKQVPLAYALMSRRSKDDYVQVFRSLRRRLGDLSVEWIMLDFEAATWQAIREVFPDAVIRGCVFHFTQRIYRKITTEGLSTAYQQHGDKFEFFRKIMSLPYLPVEQIEPAFNRLMEVAEGVGGPVLRVCEYISRTWIHGSVWRPLNWCVFREEVRTNNDLEGWHRRINARACSANLGLYKLANLLREESETVDLHIRLVSQHLLTKIRRKKYVTIHGRLHQAWDDYEEEKLTTTELLRIISHINALGPSTAVHHMLDDDEA
ncbi:uncharacterized protein LOC127874188 isoform X2 [Dreissena polymorpha]|uniref:uncharacterized protein LOC127858196 isoform X2 n=1 Tax=Dreissena polymorpha TaxID=45954 RepID=UPI002263B641|nr:uncharacterized protein LOC127858196 isoform X2 [Dreissena polymorpha]XP_052274352.1 uncharacterized protein LOC127874188 isoform X2 [Dreissena polymorpha]